MEDRRHDAIEEDLSEPGRIQLFEPGLVGGEHLGLTGAAGVPVADALVDHVTHRALLALVVDVHAGASRPAALHPDRRLVLEQDRHGGVVDVVMWWTAYSLASSVRAVVVTSPASRRLRTWNVTRSMVPLNGNGGS